MYNPKGNSKTRSGDGVSFAEAKPPPHLRDIVHRFLQIRTPAPLPQGYQFHALPDACTYAVFDQLTPDIAGITRLKASSEELNLGQTRCCALRPAVIAGVTGPPPPPYQPPNEYQPYA